MLRYIPEISAYDTRAIDREAHSRTAEHLPTFTIAPDMLFPKLLLLRLQLCWTPDKPRHHTRDCNTASMALMGLPSFYPECRSASMRGRSVSPKAGLRAGSDLGYQ